MILDEPTNDLDVETLELLEELVDGYQGTVLLVSHDREFADNSVTECWIFEGNGVIKRFAGGYYDAQQQKAQTVSLKAEQTGKVTAQDKQTKPKETVKRSNKLSYNLLRELEQLPAKLEQLESEIETLQTQVGDADFSINHMM